MSLQRRGEDWYSDSAADLKALLERHGETGDPIEAVTEVACDCGSRVFSTQTDDDYQEVALFCRACGAQYLFHTERIEGYYEGNPNAESECVNCPCTERGGSFFELAVGVTLYDNRDVDWAFVVCRCVACGRTGYLAEWHRIEYPYAELFAHLSNKL